MAVPQIIKSSLYQKGKIKYLRSKPNVPIVEQGKNSKGLYFSSEVHPLRVIPPKYESGPQKKSTFFDDGGR